MSDPAAIMAEHAAHRALTGQGVGAACGHRLKPEDEPCLPFVLARSIALLGDAVKDTCWRVVPYGETEDGDTANYIVSKGTVHRLIGAAQSIGIPASFRNLA